MKSFIFQGSPDIFDIEGYLREAVDRNISVVWQVNRYADEMSVGDRVYFWRSAGKGKTKSVAGVVGQGRLLTAPSLMYEDELSIEKYWRNPQPPDKAVRVRIEVTDLNVGAKEVVRRDWMKEDPVLNDMLIMRQASGTNFPLTTLHADRLSQLARNTGVVWTKEESMAALWLYNETYKQPISRTHDSDTALIALIIGRAVTGVYNKLMNFRSIDPRDERKGLSGVNQIDRAVWNQYFDQGTGDMNSDLLAHDFEAIWGTEQQLKEKVATSDVQEAVVEALDDDISQRREVSVVYRKGQAAFRKRLLHLYDGACAITGVDVSEVLDAAHIVDHARSGLNGSENGILLRSDIHDLFDAGLIRLDPESYVVIVDPSLKDTYYWQYNDQPIRTRVDDSQPSSNLIRLKIRTTG